MGVNHLPQRKSIRLKGYDYSRAGLYFITICCHNRACLFGHISTAKPVGADLCVRPYDNTTNVRPYDNTTNVRPDDNTTNVHPYDNINDHLNNDFNVHPYDHSDNNTKFDTRRMQLMDTQIQSIDKQTQSMDAQIQSIDTQIQSIDTQIQSIDTQIQSIDGQTQSNNGGRTHRFAPTGISDELGSITTPEMILNDAGRMVEKWYYKLENKFPDIKCHEMVVMPNHIHFIIENIGLIEPVGADLCVRPDNNTTNVRPDNNTTNVRPDNNTTNVRPDNNTTNVRPDDNTTNVRPDNNTTNVREHSTMNASVHSLMQTGEHSLMQTGEHSLMQTGEHSLMQTGEHIGSPLRTIVQWLKTMTTNEYIREVKMSRWEPFAGKLWQRNYYEHIIRNEQSYDAICEYIRNNPAKWQEDKLWN